MIRKNIMRTAEEKEAILKEYYEGRISTRAIAEKYGTNQTVFIRWERKYETDGIEGLKSQIGKKLVELKDREQEKSNLKKKD